VTREQKCRGRQCHARHGSRSRLAGVTRSHRTLFQRGSQTDFTKQDLTTTQTDTAALVQESLRAASASSSSATTTADTSAAAHTDDKDTDQGQHDLVSQFANQQ
jgi:hypothetical protein